MPATFRELGESRGGDGSGLEVVGHVLGTADDSTARSTAIAATVSTYLGLVRDVNAPHIEPIYIDTADASKCVWLARVRYVRPDRNDPTSPTTNDSTLPEFQFVGQSGQQKITHSKSTISRTAATGTAPDHKGAIGVTPDGEIEGVDIATPTSTIRITRYVSSSICTAAYLATLDGILAAPVNSGSVTWTIDGQNFTYAAGELRFDNYTATKRGGGDYQITYEFAVSRNATNISIGGVLTVSAKKGWEYLWVQYGKQPDATAKRTVLRPIAAFVEQVYNTSAYSGFGFP